MKRNIAKILFIVLLGQSLPLACSVQKEVSNIYTDIATHYLPAFNIMTKESIIELEEDGSKQESRKPDTTIKHLTPGEQRQTILALLAHYGDSEQSSHTNIFDNDYWEDLELFCGPTKNRMAHVAQSWNRTITALGDITSKRILTRPTTSIETLQNRQNAIKFLQENKDFSQPLSQALTNMAKQESIVYSFWKPESNQNKLFLDLLYFRGPLKPLNKNSLALQTSFLFENSLLGLSVLAPILSYWVSISGAHYFSSYHPSLFNSFFRDGPRLCGNGIQELITSCKENTALLAAVSAYAALYIFGSYQIVKFQKQKFDLLKYLQTRLIALSTFIREMKTIYINTIKHEPLANAIPSLHHIKKLTKATDDLASFMNVIAKTTFKGKPSYLSNSGRILAAQKLIGTIKSHLVPALEAVGEIDAYLSMATLLNEFEERNEPFCFASHIDNAKQPHLDIEDFWFPQLLHNEEIKNGEQKIVLNNITMNYEENGVSNIILTGPNTGGKSTILKALIVSLLLAQSYGIAPATSMNFTPMSKIQTYINIPDNAAEGISLFKAELLRVKQLLQNIYSIPKDQFAFTILDEVFNGTSPEEAIVGSGTIIEELSELKNSMAIIATHYGLLTKVEDYTNGKFKNYKVTTIQHEDGSLEFPYTWMPGISDQHIAMALIEQADFVTHSNSWNIAQQLSNEIIANGIR